jgi:hypothetical protein
MKARQELLNLKNAEDKGRNWTTWSTFTPTTINIIRHIFDV